MGWTPNANGGWGGSASVWEKVAAAAGFTSHNLCGQSHNFGDTNYWTLSGSTFSTGQTTDPFGVANNAGKLIDTTGTSPHYFYANGTFPTTVVGKVYIFSVHIKNGGGRSQLLLGNLGGAFSGITDCVFDASTGALAVAGSGYTIAPTMLNAGSGWYRCYFGVTCTGAQTTACFTEMGVAGSNSYAGDITKGLFIDAMQVEIAAAGQTTPTAYLQNTTYGPL